ncbi:MAG: glutamate 5-kinase [Acidimicrobiia bacterium]
MRVGVSPPARLVVKVGTSSLVGTNGDLDENSVDGIAAEVAEAWKAGHPTVLVSSGAVVSGLSALGLQQRPRDVPDLQVAAAVGQVRLMHRYSQAFLSHGLVAGQLLLTRDLLADRDQYLHARQAIDRMLSAGIVPVVNENDTVVVDELRIGDNDRLAAIVSHVAGAALFVILTDTDGLFSADPRRGEAQFLEAVDHTDDRLDRLSGAGPFGSGGAASKVTAARIAAWSRIPTVIAGANSSLLAITAGEPVGTWVEPRPFPLAARKLWIAFCQPVAGSVQIDGGAAEALVRGGKSLLAVGVATVSGTFGRGEAVDVCSADGRIVARGLARIDSSELARLVGQRGGGEVVHRDDLVVFAED